MRRYTFLLALLFVVSCKNNKKGEMISNEDSPTNEVVITGENHPGKKILEKECYICHNPKVSKESRIAPPMVAIKQHYIHENTTKDEFTEALIAWVNDPEQETKMPGAQRKFGKMPYIPYPDDALAQIAEYIYEYEMAPPEWYYANQDGGKKGVNHKNTQFQDLSKKGSAMGMEYAKAAKQALGGSLLKAIQEKGPTGAVEFCNMKAISLTDSVSVMNNAVIKRVSDKPRNLDNAANEEELGYIIYFKKLISAEIEPKPIVKTEDEAVDFYFPITTNTMCLQCHGEPQKQIRPETLTMLRKLYPNDQATGYQENEVRGLWTISFDIE